MHLSHIGSTSTEAPSFEPTPSLSTALLERETWQTSVRFTRLLAGSSSKFVVPQLLFYGGFVRQFSSNQNIQIESLKYAISLMPILGNIVDLADGTWGLINGKRILSGQAMTGTESALTLGAGLLGLGMDVLHLKLLSKTFKAIAQQYLRLLSPKEFVRHTSQMLDTLFLKTQKIPLLKSAVDMIQKGAPLLATYPKLSFIIGGSSILFGAYESFTPKPYSILTWIAHQKNKYLGKYLTLIDELKNNDVRLKIRAIESLGDLLADDGMTSKERALVLQELLPLARQNDNKEIKQSAQISIGQAIYYQQNFLKTIGTLYDSKKIAEAVAELVLIQEKRALEFLKNETSISKAVEELVYSFLEKMHWDIYLRILVEQGRVRDAIPIQKRQLARLKTASKAERANAFADLGHLYALSNNDEEALKAYQNALKLAPDHSPAMNGLVEIALKRDEGQVALGQIKKLRESKLPIRDHWKLDYNEAIAWLSMGDISSAIASLSRAIDFQAQNPIQDQEWGRHFAMHDRLDKAKDFLEKSLSNNPHNATNYNDLAVVLAKLDQTEEALAYYEEAERISPDDILILSNFLYQLGEAKQYERAYDLSEKILSKSNDKLLRRKLGDGFLFVLNKEFTEIGEGIRLQKLNTNMETLGLIEVNSLDQTQLEQEISFWKNQLTNPKSTNNEKKQALVVLARLSQFLKNDEKIDLGLEIISQPTSRSEGLEKFMAIAIDRITEGLSDDKLYKIARWLIIQAAEQLNSRFVYLDIFEKILRYLSTALVGKLFDEFIFNFFSYSDFIDFDLVWNNLNRLPNNRRDVYFNLVFSRDKYAIPPMTKETFDKLLSPQIRANFVSYLSGSDLKDKKGRPIIRLNKHSHIPSFLTEEENFKIAEEVARQNKPWLLVSLQPYLAADKKAEYKKMIEDGLRSSDKNTAELTLVHLITSPLNTPKDNLKRHLETIVFHANRLATLGMTEKYSNWYRGWSGFRESALRLSTDDLDSLVTYIGKHLTTSFGTFDGIFIALIPDLPDNRRYKHIDHLILSLKKVDRLPPTSSINLSEPDKHRDIKRLHIAMSPEQRQQMAHIYIRKGMTESILHDLVNCYPNESFPSQVKAVIPYLDSPKPSILRRGFHSLRALLPTLPKNERCPYVDIYMAKSLQRTDLRISTTLNQDGLLSCIEPDAT